MIDYREVDGGTQTSMFAFDTMADRFRNKQVSQENAIKTIDVYKKINSHRSFSHEPNNTKSEGPEPAE